MKIRSLTVAARNEQRLSLPSHDRECAFNSCAEGAIAPGIFITIGEPQAHGDSLTVTARNARQTINKKSRPVQAAPHTA